MSMKIKDENRKLKAEIKRLNEIIKHYEDSINKTMLYINGIQGYKND